MEVKDWVTAGTAITGAVLGVFNLWRSLSSDRVKLRVSPAVVVADVGRGVLTHKTLDIDDFRNAPEQIQLAVEVLNLSSFPVTIDEVGLTTSGKSRMVFLGSFTSERKGLPIRLESREAVTLYTSSYSLGEFHRGRKAYARTVCGTRTRGDSKSLRSLRRVSAEATHHAAEKE